MHPTGGTSGTGCAALQEKGNKWFEHRRKLYDKAFKFCKDNAARLEVALTLNDAALMKAGVKDEELRSTILTVLREWFNHCCSCMDDKPVEYMTSTEVLLFLYKNPPLHNYIPEFAKKKVTGVALSAAGSDTEELLRLGVSPLGHRIRLQSLLHPNMRAPRPNSPRGHSPRQRERWARGSLLRTPSAEKDWNYSESKARSLRRVLSVDSPTLDEPPPKASNNESALYRCKSLESSSSYEKEVLTKPPPQKKHLLPPAWNEQEVYSWLLESFPEHREVAESFLHHRIDGAMLAFVNDHTLQSFGISQLGLRKRVLKNINEIIVDLHRHP